MFRPHRFTYILWGLLLFLTFLIVLAKLWPAIREATQHGPQSYFVRPQKEKDRAEALPFSLGDALCVMRRGA